MQTRNIHHACQASFLVLYSDVRALSTGMDALSSVNALVADFKATKSLPTRVTSASESDNVQPEH